MKHTIIIGLILLTIATLGAGAGYTWYQQQLSAPDNGSREPVYVEIAPGMSSAAIADMLEEKGLIRSGAAFRIHARINGLSGDIKAGIYQLPSDLSLAEVLSRITEGDMAQKIIRIPGGAILLDVIEIMEENGFSKPEIEQALNASYDFSVLEDRPEHADLEGYLFPDTYHIGVDVSAREFISIVLSNTELKIDRELRDLWRGHDLDIHEGMTLASIVHKEAAEPEDQAKVAQVFLSRLKQDHKLEADPTYLYGARISGRRGSPDLDSPYNTYKYRGLPPGPISAAEEGALLAVAKPADTDYFYFVTGEDGVTRFSKEKNRHLEYIDRFGISQ